MSIASPTLNAPAVRPVHLLTLMTVPFVTALATSARVWHDAALLGRIVMLYLTNHCG